MILPESILLYALQEGSEAETLPSNALRCFLCGCMGPFKSLHETLPGAQVDNGLKSQLLNLLCVSKHFIEILCAQSFPPSELDNPQSCIKIEWGHRIQMLY